MANKEELKRLAENGDAESQFLLGVLYMDENKVEDGMYWLRKSAEQDYGHAQDCICLCYEYGIRVAKDKFQANYWGKKAEENERRGTYVLDVNKQPKCVQNQLRALM